METVSSGTVSGGMQLMNYITGLLGKHSATLAQLSLMSLAALLFLPVAVDAGFCYISLIGPPQFPFGMRRQIAVFHSIYS